MRLIPVVLLFAFALIACSRGGGTSSSSQSSTQASPQASTAASPMTAASPGEASPMAPSPGTSASAAVPAGGSIPAYPGSTNIMTATANGETTSESSTKDSFDTVYGWYKSRLPAGSEAERLTIGNVQEVVFKVGSSTASIASSNGQTVITIANKP